MSLRAAWRLEALGFEQVYDYVDGKADWLANGLPRAGTRAGVPVAGDLADQDPLTCGLTERIADVTGAVADARYGFALVLNDQRIVLGRIRRSALSDAPGAATAEDVMEPGPSTVRFDTPAAELVEGLAGKGLQTAIVTTPSGRLVGVFHRTDAGRRLASPSPDEGER